MKKLRVSDELSFPLDVVTQTLAAIARKGAGKTYFATLLAEQMRKAGAQVIAIDVVGNWWGLRVGKGGKGKGVDIYVFGGPHGDLPLTPDSGPRIARLLVEKRISAVLDISSFRKAERLRFSAAFAEEFFHLKKTQRSPVHLFVEEAQKLIPQLVRGEMAAMVGAWEDIVRLGRNYGIGCTLVSQRPQSVNKEVLSQVECLVALQVNGAHDRKALEGWMEEKDGDRGLVGELPGLAIGEAYIWSPSWLRCFKRVHIAQKGTFDASETPKVGRRRREVRLSHVDVEALKTELAEVVAAGEADDPKALKRRIAELEAAARKVPAPAPAPVVVACAVKPPRVVSMIKEADLKRIERFTARLIKAQDKLAQAQQVVVSEVGSLNMMIGKAVQQQEAIRMGVKPAAPTNGPRLEDYRVAKVHAKPSATFGDLMARVPRPTTAAKDMKKVYEHDDGDLSDYARGILTTMAQRHPATLTTSQVAILSGRSLRSSAFSGAMAKLKRRGLVVAVTHGRLMLSAAGQALAGAVEAPAAGEALRAHWLKALPDYASLLLGVLLQHHPASMTREELAAGSGKSIKSSAFSGAVSTLLKNELVTCPAPGSLVVAETLF